MIALQIRQTGSFMHRLLSTDCFDSFLLAEATLTAAVTYRIDGRLNPAFFPREEWEDCSLRPHDYASFRSMRPLLHSLMKGQRTPVGFQFVLYLMPEYVAPTLRQGGCTVPADALQALVLTIRYSGGALTAVSGVSTGTFLPDKSPDAAWDRALRRFFVKKEIDFEEA